MKNDPNHPEIARAAQDVVAPSHREDHGPHHYGRGGGGNLIPQEANQRQAQGEHAPAAHQKEGEVKAGGLVDKAKAFLGKK
jgi:hypothetical protein